MTLRHNAVDRHLHAFAYSPESLRGDAVSAADEPMLLAGTLDLLVPHFVLALLQTFDSLLESNLLLPQLIELNS